MIHIVDGNYNMQNTICPWWLRAEWVMVMSVRPSVCMPLCILVKFHWDVGPFFSSAADKVSSAYLMPSRLSSILQSPVHRHPSSITFFSYIIGSLSSLHVTIGVFLPFSEFVFSWWPWILDHIRGTFGCIWIIPPPPGHIFGSWRISKNSGFHLFCKKSSFHFLILNMTKIGQNPPGFRLYRKTSTTGFTWDLFLQAHRNYS